MTTLFSHYKTKKPFSLVPAKYGNSPYFYLLYLSFMVWKYIFSPFEYIEIAYLLLSFSVFIPIYFYSYWANKNKLILCIIACGLLGILWSPYNTGSSTFFIFGAAMCARLHPSRHAYIGIASLIIAALGAYFIFDLNFIFLILTILFSVMTGIGALSAQLLINSKEQLIQKQGEVEHLATVAERERIARDLHDLLGHTLSVITLKAELASKLVDRDVQACKNEIKDIETTARNALAEVRSAIVGFRASSIEDEIKNTQIVLSAAQVTLTTEIAPLNLPPAIEKILALSLREATTNIIRHAKASTCFISLKTHEQELILSIQDNGMAGFNQLRIQEGNGLQGMKERVQALGGQLTHRAEQGFYIELRLPFLSTTTTTNLAGAST
jgi:two-component system sensor histidine kinase DesK